MTPQQRQVIIDEIKKGTKCTEIAAMIGEKAETVQRFVRARGLLPDVCEHNLWTPEEDAILREERNVKMKRITQIWEEHFQNYRTLDAVRARVFKVCKRRSKAVTRERKQQAIEMLRQGKPYKEVAEKFGLRISYLRVLAHYNGLTKSAHSWTQEEERILMKNHVFGAKDLNRIRREYFPNVSIKAIQSRVTRLRETMGHVSMASDFEREGGRGRGKGRERVHTNKTTNQKQDTKHDYEILRKESQDGRSHVRQQDGSSTIFHIAHERAARHN